MSSAKLFAKACKRQGLAVFNYYEYPSLIKGGLQSGQVHASVTGATCQRRHLDLLVVFHEKFILDHLAEIDEHSLVIVNGNAFDPAKYPGFSSRFVVMNLTKLAREQGASPLAANIAALGVSAALLGMDLAILGRVVVEEFAKNKELAKTNLLVLQAAFQAMMGQVEQGQVQALGQLINTGVDEQILVSGNEAIGLGALAAGLQFYSAYPMTPATGLLHFLASAQNEYPIVVKHAEDEIAAINHALGAAFAGVRAMTGSSGGGFALMVESLSFAGVAEIPLVVLEGVRQGPATGLPTWTSQGDLNFVLGAGHGDFLRVVLTPGDVQEHFDLAKLAVQLAEKYQLPVLLMSDKLMLESQQTMPMPTLEHHNTRLSMVAEGKLGEVGVAENSYLRYQNTPTGISPRAIPGQSQAWQLTNSYEHDEYGFAIEDAKTVKLAVEKRLAKLAALRQELPAPVYLGNQAAEQVFISFGSTVIMWRELLKDQEIAQRIGVIHLPCVYPFPSEQVLQLLGGRSEVTVVEGDAMAQLAGLIKRETGLQKLHSLLRYDGRPFYAEDLRDYIMTGAVAPEYTLL